MILQNEQMHFLCMQQSKQTKHIFGSNEGSD